MVLVQFTDDQSLKRALGILFYESRGTFQMLPEGKLVVGDRQLQALKDAGLLDANGNPNGKQTSGTQKEE